MRTRRFRGWVIASASAAVVGGAAPAPAQQPSAANLLPINPDRVPSPAGPAVARSAYPDIPDADIPQVPVQGYAAPPQPDRSRTWIGGAWAGVKEFVVGRPTPPPPPQPALPVAHGGRPPAPRPVPQPGSGGSQPQPRVPEQPAAPPQPGVYAGPPAYRWYGWGSTTPGTNQYAPHGLYPKGSAAWHSHTGATPGAFPVPVQYPPLSPGVEPPVYAGNPQPYDATYIAPARGTRPDALPEPSFDPRTLTERAARGPTGPVGRPTMEPPPGFPSSPSIPSGTPIPVATDPRPTELHWQTVKPNPGAIPTGAPTPRASQPTSPDLQWVPVSSPGHYPGTIVPSGTGSAKPTPNITLVRGQEPAPVQPVDVSAVIRQTCFSRVSQVRIVETGPRRLTVTFVTSTEQLAREAAALVSELPDLRPYEVRFEVQLTR